MFYNLVLEPFFRKLRVNPIPLGITLPSATIPTRYSANAADMNVLVTSHAEILEVSI